MKICAISDLHGALIDNIEPCEIVLICGDIVPLHIQRTKSLCKDWLVNYFARWIKTLPCEKVIFIAGNHDFVFEGKEACWADLLLKPVTDEKAVYLNDSFYDYLSDEGKVYRIYGTPNCHKFGNWAFMYSDDTLKALFSTIPENCDILISHDAPALNDCDLVPINKWNSKPINVGNVPLANAILEKQPSYAFCGHIHEGNHSLTKIKNTNIANVSILNDNYDVEYEPLYLDI